MTAFEIDAGEVVVRTPGQGFARVAVPKGFSDETFRNALATVDILWRENGCFPTLDEMSDRWPSIPRSTWAKLLVTDEFQDALERHGVSFDLEAGLSYMQNQALQVLNNPADRRTQKAKLADIGVSWATYTGWMKNPAFAAARRKMAEGLLKDSVPMLLEQVVAGAEAGKTDLIKLGLEMSGRYDPNAREAKDFRVLASVLVESVIRHTDPDTRELILKDLRDAGILLAAGRPELEA